MKTPNPAIALLLASGLSPALLSAQPDSARGAAGPAPIEITLASGTALEEQGRAQLMRLLDTYDVERWIFTRRVRIQSRVIPHSHPVLTLNTQYLRNDTAQLATFLHEQFHWYVGRRPDADVEALGAELRRRYPTVPERTPEGARDRESTYLHLIVCTLEYEAMAALFGRDVARRTLEGWSHYTWVYRTVIADNAALVALMNRHGIGIEPPAIDAWREHLGFLGRAGTWWQASNAAYAAEDGFDAYATAYATLPGELSGRGCLWGIRGGSPGGIAWRFLQGWDPGAGAPFFHQLSPGGAVGMGTGWTRTGDTLEFVQRFRWPDGSLTRVQHRTIRAGADTMITVNRLWRDGEWVPQRSYTWVRQHGAGAACEGSR